MIKVTRKHVDTPDYFGESWCLAGWIQMLQVREVSSNGEHLWVHRVSERITHQDLTGTAQHKQDSSAGHNYCWEQECQPDTTEEKK